MSTTHSWMEPRITLSPVNGEEVEFHEVSVSMFSKLRPIAELATSAILQLMRNARDDAGSLVVQNQSGETEFSKEETHLTVSPELSTYHDTKRAEAIHQLAEALMGEKNQRLLSQFICDALRDDEIKPQDLRETVGGGVFVQLLRGALRANTEVFGPLAPLVSRVLDMGLTRSEDESNPLNEVEETLRQTLSPTLGNMSPKDSPSSEDAVSTSTT